MSAGPLPSSPTGSPPAAPPASPPPLTAPYPPPTPPYYYPPPPPARSTGLPLIVVIVAVIFAFSIILPAVLYIMVSGLVSEPEAPPAPTVTFTGPTLSGDTVSFSVTGVSRAASFSSYRASVRVNATAGVPQPLSSSFTITVSGDPYQVNVVDADGEGTLSGGDQFRVIHAGGFAPGTSYEFVLLWPDEARGVHFIIETVRWP